MSLNQNSAKKTETLGINNINKLCEHDLLYSTLKEGDKYPSVDGTIDIYSSNTQTKDTLVNSVMTQVKSIRNSKKYNSKNCSYPLVRSDLENFKKYLGVIFFISISDSNNEKEPRLFYKYLFNDEINKLLFDMKGTKKNSTISVEFKELNPKTKENFYNLIKEFSDKQLKIKENAKIETINLSNIHMYDLKDYKLKIQKNKHGFTYDKENFGEAKTKLGYIVNIRNDVEDFSLLSEIKNISINNKIYYSNKKRKINIDKNENKIYFSNNILFSSTDLYFSIDETDTLNNVLHDINFILDLKKFNELKIDDELYFDFNITNEMVNSLQKIKNNIEIIKHKCIILNFNLDNLIYKHIDEDFVTLLQLEQFANSNKNNIILCQLSEYKYPFLIKENEIKYIFNENPPIRLTINKQHYIVPLLSYFKYNVLKELKISEETFYLDFDCINIESIKYIEGFLNNLLLDLILIYDETNNHYILNMLKELSELLKENCSEDFKYIAKINELQIKYRENKPFTKIEVKMLNEILKDDKKDHQLKFCIEVLLNNYKKAKYYYNTFNIEEKKLFESLPIINLYKKLK